MSYRSPYVHQRPNKSPSVCYKGSYRWLFHSLVFQEQIVFAFLFVVPSDCAMVWYMQFNLGGHPLFIVSFVIIMKDVPRVASIEEVTKVVGRSMMARSQLSLGQTDRC